MAMAQLKHFVNKKKLKLLIVTDREIHVGPLGKWRKGGDGE